MRELKSRKSPTARKIWFRLVSSVVIGLSGAGGGGGCEGGMVVVDVVVVIDVVVL